MINRKFPDRSDDAFLGAESHNFLRLCNTDGFDGVLQHPPFPRVSGKRRLGIVLARDPAQLHFAHVTLLHPFPIQLFDHVRVRAGSPPRLIARRQ